MLALIKERETYLAPSFLRAFKANLKQGSILWILQTLIGFLLLMDLAVYFRSTQTNLLAFLLMLLFFSVLLVFLFIFTWVYGILAKFDNTIQQGSSNGIVVP